MEIRHKSCGEVARPSLKLGEAYLSAENTWYSSKKSFSNCGCLVKSSSKAREISEIQIVYRKFVELHTMDLQSFDKVGIVFTGSIVVER